MSLTKRAGQSNRFALLHKPLRLRQGSVLHLVPDFEPEDTTRAIIDLGIHCQRSGCPAMVASGGGAMVIESERAAIPHRSVSFSRPGVFKNWRLRRQLEEIMKQVHPRLFHSHGPEVLALAASFNQRHRLPLVASLSQPSPSLALTPTVRQMLLSSPTALFCAPTLTMTHHLEKAEQIPLEKIRTIPSGVNLERYRIDGVSSERLASLARLWRLPEQGAIFLIPLPLWGGMGQEAVLEAVAALKDESVYVVFIGHDRGQPGQRAALERSIAALNLMGRVSMPEFCEDWPAAFWHASAVILPNHLPRGSSQALLAAQAMGRPVIVTDCGANRELTCPESGIVIAPKDHPALLAALERVLSLNDQQRQEINERGRAFVAKKYSERAWLEATLSMYEEVSGHPTEEPRASVA